MNEVKNTSYTAPTLDVLTLSVNDILLASGEVTPRGELDTLDPTSVLYINKTWTDVFD